MITHYEAERACEPLELASLSIMWYEENSMTNCLKQQQHSYEATRLHGKSLFRMCRSSA